MPEGKRWGSATMVPSLSRETCQQSSITMYSYPASRMPLATIASASLRMRSSLTLQANLFQLFQPIGGVLASPLSSALREGAQNRKEETSRRKVFMDVGRNGGNECINSTCHSESASADEESLPLS